MPTQIELSKFNFSCPIHPPSFPTPAPTPTNPIAPDNTYTIIAPPYTDLWRKPGLDKAHKFPFFRTSLHLSEFHSATVSFNASWATLYDQGGIALIFPALPDTNNNSKPRPDDDGHPLRWIKAGVEYVDDAPRFSIVVANKGSWADWTLVGSLDDTELVQGVTLEMVREGPSLVVNIVRGGKKSAVREITWVFEQALLEDNPEVQLGAYAAKPVPEKGNRESEGLPVKFTAIKVFKRAEGDRDEDYWVTEV